VRATLLWGDRRPSATIWGVEGRMEASVVVVSATEGFVIQRQNEVCRATFGQVAGSRWMGLRTAPGEVIERTYRAIEEAVDTGRLIRVDAPSHESPGVLSAVLLQRSGNVMVSWKPTAPVIGRSPVSDLESFCRQAADHLDRLATALEQGLPLPHFPSALRPDPQPVPGSPPAAR
jgi:hypothetical protein